MATMMRRQEEEEEGRRTKLACTICYNDYDNDHIPIMLICCGNTLCLECFEKHQANQVGELGVHDIWYSCPISKCRLSKNTGFNRSNKCYEKNRMLMEILGIDPASSTTVVANSNQNEVGLLNNNNNNSSAGEKDATSPASAAAVADTAGSVEDNMIDLSHDADDDASPTRQTNNQSVTNVLRRSQRIRRPPAIRDIPTDATRNATMNRDRRSISANERNRRVKRRTVHNISTIGGNVTLETPSVDNEFTNTVKKARNLWCIRQFTKDSRTDTDRLGRYPSEWALGKGYILASDRLLYAAGYPDHPLEYLRETDIEAIKNACRNSDLFPPGENLSLYCGRYQKFSEIEKGDMVVMNVPGRPKEGEAYFGVVTSNSLRRMSPDECREEGFPAMHLLPSKRYNGIMLRDVKWLRKGLVRKLPGQQKNVVPWINESVTVWLSKSKGIHSGLEIMKRSSFMENTSRV
jgi:hypothetical protein